MVVNVCDPLVHDRYMTRVNMVPPLPAFTFARLVQPDGTETVTLL